MPVPDLLTSDRVVMLVDPGHRDAVLDAAARLLADGSWERTQAIGDGLRARERVASTGIGRGVALPHCRSNAYAHARGAFLRLAHPVDFCARDGEPVDLVFAMCVPEDGTRQHLHTMAGLTERFSDPLFREALRDARDLAGLRDALMSPRREDVWSIVSA